MKTQKEINQAFKKLLFCDLEGYPENSTPWDVFVSENGYDIRRLGDVGAVKSWMLGLPSILCFPFTYHRIGLWLEEETGYTGDCFDSDVQDKRFWEKCAVLFVKMYKPKA